MTAPAVTVLVSDPAAPGRLRRFHAAQGVIRADTPDQVPAALEAMRAALAEGRHLAGWCAYELGYALEPALAAYAWTSGAWDAGQGPLLWFGVFDAPEPATLCETVLVGTGRAYAGPPVFEWDERAYAERFDRAHALIGAGDIYQVNLAMRARFAFAGDPLALFARLARAAHAPHAAYVHDGARHILSLSPELFFDLRGGTLTARPMKGTGPRGHDAASDAAARDRLAASPKDRAENLMIVDLLRNDLGRIARTGTVAVPDLFRIETYPSLHAMTSTVTARARENLSPRDVLRALFPCGSITGAPKIRAMQVLRDLESGPRGAYCGAIGWFAPDGDASFNVAIRTITVENNRGTLGIGGGVVQDSNAASEYAECLLKSRFLTDAREPLGLIETMRYTPGQGLARRDAHLARMQASARALGLPFDAAAARAVLDAVAGDAALRVRLALDESGAFALATAPLGSPQTLWRYAISPHRLAAGDALARHKITWRAHYDGEAARLKPADEVLFLNDRGELAEGSRSTLFLEMDGMLLTPPLSAGILDGVLRRELIGTGRAREKTLMPADLDAADAVWFGNALRGLVRGERA